MYCVSTVTKLYKLLIEVTSKCFKKIYLTMFPSSRNTVVLRREKWDKPLWSYIFVAKCNLRHCNSFLYDNYFDSC